MLFDKVMVVSISAMFAFQLVLSAIFLKAWLNDGWVLIFTNTWGEAGLEALIGVVFSFLCLLVVLDYLSVIKNREVN